MQQNEYDMNSLGDKWQTFRIKIKQNTFDLVI